MAKKGQTSNALHSMTGFATYRLQTESFEGVWEIKTLNNKGLDIRLRLPDMYTTFEPEMIKCIQSKLARGSVQVQLTLQTNAHVMNVRVNKDLLYQILNLREELKGMIVDEPMSLETLLKTKDLVVMEPETAVIEEATEELLTSLDEVLDKVIAMRLREGKHLQKVLNGHVNQLEKLVTSAAKHAETQPTGLMKKISAQMKELTANMPDLPEDRLAQEAAVLVNRADVREEIDRMQSHLKQIKDILKKGGPAGRRLDFIAQELTREANTLCSKARAVNLTQIGLDLKNTIEQFREQVQNLE